MYGVSKNCPTFNELRREWINADGKERDAIYSYLWWHRQNCPTCRAETAALTQWAERAQMPAIDVEATR